MATVVLSHPGVASAHPLGNFTINRYSRIELTVGKVQIRYVLDIAEIPTFQEMPSIDLDKNDRISERERAAYLGWKVADLGRGLSLTINGTPTQLGLAEQELDFPPGQGGLPTLRVSFLLQGAIDYPNRAEVQNLYYRDDNYPERLGWKEIVVQAGQGVSLLNSTAPQYDRSNELRAYPKDMLKSPEDQQEARSAFVVSGLDSTTRDRGVPKITQPAAKSDDILTSLVTAENLSLPLIFVAFIVALGLGAVHAASPGHGKTIMAAYLVGTRGTAKHALFLGVTVTISHTLGVLGLGLIVLYASRHVTPERLYPWLGLLSGAIIIGIGAWLLVSWLRGRDATPHEHHDHAEAESETRSDTHDGTEGPRVSGHFRRISDMAARTRRSHPRSHHHSHDAPQSGDRLSITWRTLAALGVVGGMVPSVAALIILLAAISVHRIGFGLLLILAFSAGMAGVLAGLGLLLVYARGVLERFQSKNRLIGRFRWALPLGTTLLVLASGIVVTLRAVFQVSAL